MALFGTCLKIILGKNKKSRIISCRRTTEKMDKNKIGNIKKMSLPR